MYLCLHASVCVVCVHAYVFMFACLCVCMHVCLCVQGGHVHMWWGGGVPEAY